MANAFKEQLSDPDISNLSFEDRFGLLVDKEWATRKNNHLTRLIKKVYIPFHQSHLHGVLEPCCRTSRAIDTA